MVVFGSVGADDCVCVGGMSGLGRPRQLGNRCAFGFLMRVQFSSCAEPEVQNNSSRRGLFERAECRWADRGMRGIVKTPRKIIITGSATPANKSSAMAVADVTLCDL